MYLDSRVFNESRRNNQSITNDYAGLSERRILQNRTTSFRSLFSYCRQLLQLCKSIKSIANTTRASVVSELFHRGSSSVQSGLIFA